MKALTLTFIFLSAILVADARPRHMSARLVTAEAAAGASRFIMPPPRDPEANEAALSRFFAARGRGTLQIPAGTYLLPCGSHFFAVGELSIAGAGIDRTILQFDKPCMLTAAVMAWTSKSNVHLSGFTLDLNDSHSVERQNVLQFQAYQGNADRLKIDHVAIINGNSPSLQISVAAAGGFTYSGVVIDANRLQMRPARSQNQCIALSTVNGVGKIPAARITNNVCVGSGIQIDGKGPLAVRNDVSGYQFGTGIFTAFVQRIQAVAASWTNGRTTLRFRNAPHAFVRGEQVHVWGASPASYNGTFEVAEVTPESVSYAMVHDPGLYEGGAFVAPGPSSTNCIIRDNILHDTQQTLDVNRTAPGGIENNCPDSSIEDNLALNLGGAGFINFASGTHYVGNRAIGVGFSGHDSAGGDGDNAAFVVFDNGSGMPWYRSSGLVFENNSSELRGDRPRYGYFEEAGHLFEAIFRSDRFNGAERPALTRSSSCRAAPAQC